MWKYNKEYRQELKAVFKQLRWYIHRPDFRRMIISGYNSPNYLEVNNRGDEYQGVIVYEIHEYGYYVGFFAEFLYLLKWLYFADNRGFIPYVSWGKECMYYEDNGVRGEQNAFLYYFAPVSDIVQDSNAAHVICADYPHVHAVQDELDTHGYDVSPEYMDALSEMVRKYIRYNNAIKLYLEECYASLIGEKKALAVHFRGTDFRRQYNNHPVFVTIEQEIEVIHKILEKKDYELIFVATDEQEAINKFAEEFGEMVVCFDDTYRASDGDESVAYSTNDRDNHHYRLGLEVLRDQYMLTRCDGLVCGLSNLTLSARMMRNAWYEKGYEDLVVIDNDICHNEKRFCDASH